MKNYIIILAVLFTSIICAQKSDFKDIDFSKADSIAIQYKGASLKNMPLLAYKLTSNLTTDAEKFRAIYFWVSHNIKSDYYATNKILNKGKKYRNNRSEFIAWNNTHKKDVIKKLVDKKETICTGYALVVKELSAIVGIECKIINGYHKGPSFDPKKPFLNHSWNAVSLNNKWYLCDSILASGYYFIDEDKFVFEYNDGFFLAEPILFANNHYPENKKWTLLEKDKFTYTDFIERPYIYGKTFEHNIAPIFPSKLEYKTPLNKSVKFELEIEKEKIKNFKLITNNGWKEKRFSPIVYSYIDGILTFNHQFVKKGLYDVHFKIADDIVTTYTIEVL